MTERGPNFVQRWKAETARLYRDGLYDPAEERDACGVGLVVAIDGKPRREVVELGIAALGFEPEDLPARFDSGLGVTRSRTLAIDPKRFTTSLEGVFAAGDIVRGASLVVWAIRDGQDAAQAIHQWISARAEAPLSVAAE